MHAYTWGDPADSRLGGVDMRRHHTPQAIKTLDDALRRMRSTISHMPLSNNHSIVSCGSARTLVLTTAGQLLAWGCGTHGQLGYGDLWDREDPVMVPTLRSVTAFAAGDRHTIAVIVPEWTSLFGILNLRPDSGTGSKGYEPNAYVRTKGPGLYAEASVRMGF